MFWVCKENGNLIHIQRPDSHFKLQKRELTEKEESVQPSNADTLSSTMRLLVMAASFSMLECH